MLLATQSRTETGTRENPKLRDASRFTFAISNSARPVPEDAAMGVGDVVLGRVVDFGFNRACNFLL